MIGTAVPERPVAPPTASIRVIERALQWARLHRRTSMPLPRRLQLLWAAARDSLSQAVAPQRSPTMQSPRDAVLRLPAFGAAFSVRRRTDDLYHILPGREGDVHHAILDPLAPGDVLVDGGANIGYYAVLGALRVGVAGEVLAIEAVPPTAAQLRRNVALNGLSNVRIAECAVTERATEAVRVAAPRGQFGLAHVTTAEDGSPAWAVRGATLDALCRSLPRIAVLKLDIEGSEVAALRGATETLERTERVVVECNQDRREIEALLVRAGFRVTPLRSTTYILATR